MAAGVVEQVARGNGLANWDEVSQYWFDIVLPSTINSGDLLVAVIVDNQGTGLGHSTNDGGFSAVGSKLNNGTDVGVAVFKKTASGTEDGATITFNITYSGFARFAYHVYRISGVSGSVESSSSATGTSTSPDPNSISPSWGSADTLWLPLFGADANTADPVTHPTNYATNGIYDENNNSAGVGLGSSYRANTASSEDVGAWTISASEQWIAITLAIEPVTTQTLTPSLFDDSTDTFHAPTVSGNVTLTASLFDDSTDTFPAATVTPGAVALTAPLLDDSVDTFYAPEVGMALAPSLSDDSGDTFYAPTVEAVYPDWPASLPQYFDVDGYVERAADLVIESPVDVGPPKARKRFTAGWRAISGNLRMDATQAAALEDFYRNDLNSGVTPFNWVNPFTQAAARFRFRGRPPSLTIVTADHVVAQVELWQLP